MENKILKLIGITIIVFVSVYALFTLEEAVRLSKDSNAKPLIILEENYNGGVGDAIYKSLGFTLKTEYASVDDSNNEFYPIAQEFLLFDKFLIWAWIN